jgi:hypothetical protein
MQTNVKIGELQSAFLTGLQPVVENDGRIRAAWLEGSLGRGDADRYSDIDLHLLIDAPQIEPFRTGAEQWLEAISPLVLYRLLFNGGMINALTTDGLRIDIWLHDGQTAELAAARSTVLYETPSSIVYVSNTPATIPDLGPALEVQICEFWRCIALTPSVVGRDELLVSLSGLGLEVKLLTDILVDGYEAPRDSGVKKLNAFLPGETREALESALHRIEMTQRSMAASHLQLAAILREHGPIIAERQSFAYPHELEQAVLAHVAYELKLIGISSDIG